MRNVASCNLADGGADAASRDLHMRGQGVERFKQEVELMNCFAKINPSLFNPVLGILETKDESA